MKESIQSLLKTIENTSGTVTIGEWEAAAVALLDTLEESGQEADIKLELMHKCKAISLMRKSGPLENIPFDQAPYSLIKGILHSNWTDPVSGKPTNPIVLS